MSQPVPPPAPPQKSSNSWVFGCAIGCAVIVLIGILAAVALYFIFLPQFQEGMEQAKREMAADLGRQYEQAKEAGRVPEEHQPLFDELMTMAQSEDMGFFAVAMSSAAVMSFVQDGQINEEELAAAQDLRDFMEQNPNANFMQFGQFVESHPSLQRAFESAQMNYGNITVPESEVEPAAEEDVPQPPPIDVEEEPAGAEAP